MWDAIILIMHFGKKFSTGIRFTFIFCTVLSVLAIFYSKIIAHDYEILTTESGLPDIEITYEN